MKISLEALQAIDAIDRTGSFAKAADELFKVRSALTYTIKKLESDLGVKIFDRSGHKAKLTDAGKILLKGGRALLRETALLEEHVQGAEKGFETELRVAYNDIIPIKLFGPLIKDFQKKFPRTSLRLQAERLQGCLDALISKRADLSIGVTSDETLDGSISSTPFGEIQFEFCVSKNHPLANLRGPLKHEQISEFYSIIAADSSLNLPLRSAGLFEGQEKITVSSIEEKFQLQLLGIGVGFLPNIITAPYVKRGELIIKKTLRGKPSAKMSLAWRNTQESQALLWFIEKLRSENYW